MSKLKRSDVLISTVILFLGVVAAVLGVVAETKRIKTNQVILYEGRCIYPSNPTLTLGIIAAFALVICQLVANVAGGCICCSRMPTPYPPTSSKSLAILSLVLSWITFSNAFLLLLAAASLQNRRRRDDLWFGGQCFVVRPGVFATGALLSLATSIFGVTYVLASRNFKRQTRDELPGIAMGQPYMTQFGPVFTPHELYQGQQTDHSHPIGDGIGGNPPRPITSPYTSYPVQPQTNANATYNHPKG